MKQAARYISGAISLVVAFFVFIVPFAFVAITAVKDRAQSARLDFSLPVETHIIDNFWSVISVRDYMLLTAFTNSIILTVASVTLLVVFASMVGFILARRQSHWSRMVNALILIGLMFPPAIVPTIWVLKGIGLFKTLPGLILIEVAYGLPFSVLLYRAFIASIPKELEEAAIIDGARPLSLFFRVIFPLLKPVTITNIVVQSVSIFNDFTNPLYYLPGKENATVQLTLFNFITSFSTSYNLLFMNILLITIPPLILYIFFNKQIVSGMTSGAVKG